MRNSRNVLDARGVTHPSRVRGANVTAPAAWPPARAVCCRQPPARGQHRLDLPRVGAEQQAVSTVVAQDPAHHGVPRRRRMRLNLWSWSVVEVMGVRREQLSLPSCMERIIKAHHALLCAVLEMDVIPCQRGQWLAARVDDQAHAQFTAIRKTNDAAKPATLISRIGHQLRGVTKGPSWRSRKVARFIR